MFHDLDDEHMYEYAELLELTSWNLEDFVEDKGLEIAADELSDLLSEVTGLELCGDCGVWSKDVGNCC